MRKLLFLSLAVAFSASAIAQNTHVLRPRVDVKNMSKMTSDNLIQNQNAIPKVTAKRVLPPANNQIAAEEVPLSSATNAFGNFYIGKSLLQYDKNINTVTFFHRNNPAATGDPNTGYYRFDKSTTGGGPTTWTLDMLAYGPILNPANTMCGRYPLGTIGNPVGNTDPNNGYEVYDGVWHDGVVWHGQVYGAAKLDGSTHTENYDSTNASSGNMVWIEDLFASKQNVMWRMGIVEGDNAGTYADSLMIEKGTWTGSDYSYTRQNLYFPVNSSLATRPYDMNIAFSDDGMTGYAVCINNADEGNMVFTTGAMYLQMYITKDGGATWTGNTCPGGDPTKPLDLDVTYALSGSPNLSPVGSAWFGNPDSTFGVTGWGAARPDFDMAVDGSGNLHILIGVFPQFSFGETSSNPNEWGLADLYTVDGGANWFGQLVAKPNTYLGNLGDATNVQEGVRPFVTRSWDGTKMFFGWFDTSPDFGVPTNDFPDMYIAGWDLSSNMWTAVTNMTQGSGAEGSCGFGLGSYYAMDNGTDYEIPGVYMTMTSDANGVCDFHYINDAIIPSSAFVNTAPAAIPLHSCTVGIPQISLSSNFSVSANYPNPFNGKTTVNVTLPAATDVTIEVTNMVGQMMSSNVYTSLSAGVNKLTIDGSSFAKGMYTYKVIAGKDIATRTMMVR